MKKSALFFALIIGLLTSATLQAQTVNMSRYITLTVEKDSAIMLEFKAAADGTPVRIVSGSNTQDITVGTSWTGFSSYTAYGTTMTVYGDLTGFSCPNNGTNLTAIDLSQNTQLTKLICPNNRLTSLDVSKNTRLEKLDCYRNNLGSLDVSKNTQLTYLNCFSNLLSSLDVSQNTQLTDLYCYDNNFTTAALDNIYCTLPNRTGKEYGGIYPVYNSSSSNHATVLATNAANATAKNWKVQYSDGKVNITTTGSYVCSGGSSEPNMSRYITLTVAKNSAIRLDFKAAAAATPVRIVSGSNTQDITVGTSWYDGNSPSTYTVTAGASTMTIYGDIINFDCAGNGANITALDLSHNTQLTVLNCRNNSLNSLDISQNTQLEALYCHGNKFTTATLDDIFCALPDRTGNTNGKIQPIFNSSSPNHATVLATNAANATAKNWKVQYYNDNTDIPTTTGKHKCSATDIAEAAAEPALTLYPNPVADVLYLSANARTIRIYNIYGTEVAHATDTDRVEVSHLPAGIYTVRADGTVAKMVKR